MNDLDVKLVQTSFANLAPKGDEVARMFYAELFAAHPELRPMFAADIAPQAKRLTKMLTFVVKHVDRLPTILPAVQGLALRHRGYGVTEAHYAMVGTALIASVARGLGDDFTPQVRQAWIAVYTVLAGTMMAAARSRTAA
jgi:hemoglobin-like flavoprotein